MSIFSGTVVDLIHDGLIPEWGQCLDYIRTHCSFDPLYSNYIDLDLNEFISFPVVIEDGHIIAFSGAQVSPSKWGPLTARISSRMWIHPDKRQNSFTKFNPESRIWYNSQLIIPKQIPSLITAGIRTIFISRKDHRRSFTKFIDLVNINLDQNLTVIPGEYWVCGNSVFEQACKQIIAVGSLFDQDPMVDIREFILEATS